MVGFEKINEHNVVLKQTLFRRMFNINDIMHYFDQLRIDTNESRPQLVNQIENAIDDFNNNVQMVLSDNDLLGEILSCILMQNHHSVQSGDTTNFTPIVQEEIPLKTTIGFTFLYK